MKTNEICQKTKGVNAARSHARNSGGAVPPTRYHICSSCKSAIAFSVGFPAKKMICPVCANRMTGDKAH